MPNAEPAPILNLFLKAPREGWVKTRLAREVGAARACRIYRTLVAAVIREVPATWDRRVWFAPSDALPEMRQWLGPAFRYHPQADGDLGRKLGHALGVTNPAGTRPVFFIGGDCATLSQSLLLRAESELQVCDVVLGPAKDGGYYLLGVKTASTPLFEGIDWSTDRVLTQTLERASAQGLRVRLLDPLEDVDDLGSWERTRHALGLAEEPAA